MEEICRTCLNKNEKLLPITSLVESNCQIIDYFAKYLQINLTQNHNFPSNICIICLNKLLDVRRFHQQCQDSENYLKLNMQIPDKRSKTEKLDEPNQSEFKSFLKQVNNSIHNVNETLKISLEEIFEESGGLTLLKEEDLNEEYLEIDRNIENELKPQITNESDNSLDSTDFVHYEILDEYATDLTKSPINSEMQINDYKCPVCNERFKHFKNLEFHKKLFHEKTKWNPFNEQKIDSILYKSTKSFNETALTCKQCQCKFAFRTNYKIHMRRHSQKGNYPNESCICSICGKKFDDKIKLRKHTYRHNTKNNEVVCPICNKIFKAKYHLKIHMNQHTGAKPFQCNFCNKNFVSPSSLRLHKTLHEGKKIECPMCDVKLAARTQLKIHMRMHTNERPYACPQCPKRYKQLCALKVHTATHSGVKSVQCEECSACFYSKNHLLSHKIKIHRPKRFHCDKCPRKFPTPFQMKAHLLSIHKICIKDLSAYEINKIKHDMQ